MALADFVCTGPGESSMCCEGPRDVWRGAHTVFLLDIPHPPVRANGGARDVRPPSLALVCARHWRQPGGSVGRRVWFRASALPPSLLA